MCVVNTFFDTIYVVSIWHIQANSFICVLTSSTPDVILILLELGITHRKKLLLRVCVYSNYRLPPLESRSSVNFICKAFYSTLRLGQVQMLHRRSACTAGILSFTI